MVSRRSDGRRRTSTRRSRDSSPDVPKLPSADEGEEAPINTPLSSGETIVRVGTRAGGALVWLEIDYPGLTPPTSLFAALDRLGWSTPSPMPPPRSAIDWSRPDPSTGERYTVRPWQVTDAHVEAPRGSGPGGRWTPEERAQHLGLLAGVLLACDCSVEDPSGLLPALAATAPTSAPDPGTLHRSADNVSSLDRGWSRIEFVVPESAAAVLGRVLPGGDLRVTREERTIVERFRGSTYERTVVDLRVVAILPTGDAETAVESLEELGLTPEVSFVGDDERDAHLHALSDGDGDDHLTRAPSARAG